MDPSAFKTVIDGLDSQRTGLVWKLNAWTWLGAVGVVCEIVFIAWDHWSGLREWKEARTRASIPFPSRPSRIKLTLEILSVIAVVAGIVGELHVEAQLGDLDNKIQGSNSQQVAELENETQSLKTAADVARDDMVTAQADLARITGPPYSVPIIHNTARPDLSQSATQFVLLTRD